MSNISSAQTHMRSKNGVAFKRYVVSCFSSFCMEKNICMSLSRSFHPSSDGQTESEAVPAYGQPYSLQRHPTRDPLYSAHHMMQHPATVATASKTITAYSLLFLLHRQIIGCMSFAGPQQPRPSSTQNVYQSYETTQSPIAYGSPGQQSASSSVLSRIQKPANTSPTPQAWAIGRQQPVTEGYQYSQLSPSRSPSGPTYTQLSSGARTPATQQYHAVTTVPNNPGLSSNIFLAMFSR